LIITDIDSIGSDKKKCRVAVGSATSINPFSSLTQTESFFDNILFDNILDA
jgi:hypothetical protein